MRDMPVNDSGVTDSRDGVWRTASQHDSAGRTRPMEGDATPETGALLPSEVLAHERDRAERMLNVVRIAVLALLGVAAMLYAPSLTPELNSVNRMVLLPTLAWSVLQIPLFHRRRRLPRWLRIVNPLVDITAVSCIIGGYATRINADPGAAVADHDGLLHHRRRAPVASTTRKAAMMSALAVGEYGALVIGFVASGRLALVTSPIAASAGSTGVSPLDEGARLFLLACAGAVATYATHWQERLSARYAEASRASEQLQARLDRRSCKRSS